MGKTIFWVLALGIEIYQFYQYHKAMNYYRSILRILKSLDVKLVSDLTNKFGKQITKVGDFVLCMGNLKASQLCKSRLNPKMPIVYSQLLMEKIFQMGDKSNRIIKLLQKVRPTFLSLTDFQNSIKVYQTAFTEMITSISVKSHRKISENIPSFNWLISIFEKISHQTKSISLIYQQKIIPANSVNVLFGRVSKNTSGQIYFQKPHAIGANKEKIIDQYFGKMNHYRMASYFVIVIGLITLFLFYNLSLKKKIAKTIKKQATDILDQHKKIVVKQRECHKCHEKLSSVICHPCGHLNYCSDCASFISKCYQCKRSPKKEIQIYAS